MGKGKKVTVGWKYYMGIHLILCHGPADQIEALSFGERLAWTGPQIGSGDITVNNPKLFGGDAREGGVSGTIHVCMGEDAQVQNGYLRSLLGTTIPAYRGVVGLVLNRFFIGSNNPYVKDIAIRLRRMVQGWNGGVWYEAKININGAMNGAHIIYQCLTDPEWGMGYPTSSIDDVQFRSAADQLYTESFGLCLLWEQQAKIEDFIKDVVDHIGAVVRADPNTGLFQLQLIRDNYTISTLYNFNENNISTLTSYQRPNWGETTNEIVVGYTDMLNGTKKTIAVQDLSNVAIQNSVVSSTREYPGIVTDDMASRVAMRDLRGVSTPLAKIGITTNREGFNLTIGDVASFSWKDYGIVNMPIRILNVSLGTLIEGSITIEAIEDIFGLPATAYIQPQPINFTDTSQEPAPITEFRYFEIPYYDLVRTIATAEFGTYKSTSAFFGALAVAPNTSQYSFELTVASGSTYEIQGESEFCPRAIITAGITYSSTSVAYGSAIDIDTVALRTYALIDNEYIEILSIDTTAKTITFNRGVLDSIPAIHAANSIIYFMDGHYAPALVEYLPNDVVNSQLLSVSALGVLDPSLASFNSFTMVGRFGKPYPPATFQLESLFYPTLITKTTETLLITWSHRSRTQQTAGLVGTNVGSIGPEAGTTYNLRVYDNADNSVLTAQTLIGGTTYTHTGFQYGMNNTRVELESVRDGLISYQQHSYVFDFNYVVTPPQTPSGFTSSLATLNGVTGLTAPTLTLGTPDNGYYDLAAIPFKLNFATIDYGNDLNGGIFMGTNSYITFGAGSTNAYGLSATNPGLAIHIGSGDRSQLSCYQGATDSGKTWTIRFEGDLVKSGSGTTLIWEMKFFDDQVIQLTIGAHAGLATSIKGVSDGISLKKLALVENKSYILYSNPTGTQWFLLEGSRVLVSFTVLLHFEEANNSVVIRDEERNVFTVYGDAKISTTTPLINTSSLLLDGVGDYITCPSTSKFVFGSGDFTVEAFIKTTATGIRVIAEHYLSDVSGTWQLNITSTNKLGFFIRTTGYVATGTTSINNGVRHHVAVSRQGTTLRLFVDGILEATVTDSTALSGVATYFAVGAQVSSRNSAYDFNGQIDEVRVSKALARYTANFTPVTTGFPNV